jgi:hypothetical protein
MTLQELNQLKLIVDKDLKFTDDNISQKMLDQPYFFHKILDLYIKEKRELDKLDREKKRIYKERYDFYKFKNDFRLDSQKEIECYINGDKIYDDICLAFNLQEIVTVYFVELLDMIKKMSFTMGNYIKYKAFLAGTNL